MKLPQIQLRMVTIALTLRKYGHDDFASQLEDLAMEIGRRQLSERAPNVSAKMTPEIGASMRRMKRLYPDFTLDTIARLHHVNGGRAHEALYGKRQ